MLGSVEDLLCRRVQRSRLIFCLLLDLISVGNIICLILYHQILWVIFFLKTPINRNIDFLLLHGLRTRRLFTFLAFKMTQIYNACWMRVRIREGWRLILGLFIIVHCLEQVPRGWPNSCSISSAALIINYCCWLNLLCCRSFLILSCVVPRWRFIMRLRR